MAVCQMLTILTLLMIGGTSPADEPTAAEVLQRAATFQRGDTPVERPSAFHGRFFLTARKPEGGGSVSLDVERRYQRAPQRMHTRRSEASLTRADSVVAYDQGSIWIQDNRTGEAWLCNDDPETFRADMDHVREQLRISQLLLDVMTVDGLMDRLGDLRWVARQEYDLGRSRRPSELREVDVVRGRLPDELFGPDPDGPPPMPGDPPPQLQVELSVDVETGALYRVHMTTLGRAEPLVYVVRMRGHRPNRQGFLVPGNLKVYDEREQPLADVSVVPDEDDFPVLELDPTLAGELFAVPSEAVAATAAAQGGTADGG